MTIVLGSAGYVDLLVVSLRPQSASSSYSSWIMGLIHLTPVISVTEVNLARVARALEGEVKGGSSLEGGG